MAILEGVNVAAVTPRRSGSHQIDVGAMLELVDFLVERRVDGIALLGSTGEFLHFDFDDRARLAKFVIRRSRVPVAVNVSHSTLDGAVALAEEAAGEGAEALLLMPPYFFPYSQQEVSQFYLAFAKALDEAAPILLYNVPCFTTEIACETALELLATGRFAGIKDSSGDMEYFRRLTELRQKQPFTILVGNDVVFSQARPAGADGVVSGVACAVPELMVALNAAIRDGDAGKSARLDARLQEFIAWIDRFPVPAGIKAAVASRGLVAGPLATPLGPDAEQLLVEFCEWFHGWLDAVQAESKGV